MWPFTERLPSPALEYICITYDKEPKITVGHMLQCWLKLTKDKQKYRNKNCIAVFGRKVAFQITDNMLIILLDHSQKYIFETLLKTHGHTNIYLMTLGCS